MPHFTEKEPCPFDIQGQQFLLLPEKVLFLPDKQWLFIADPHFGKAAHFRKAGIPIPENLHVDDLAKIQCLIADYKPLDIYFLGDLFHSDINEAWLVLDDFVNSFENINFHLIKGNHDILPETLYQSTKWIIHREPLVLDNLILTHEPLKKVPVGLFNLCGHVHPGISLKGVGKQYMRLPCFFVSPDQMILPAFGRFTGLAAMKCTIQDQAFVTTEKKVIPII
jgi:DNA ligase-associated metallophosphoesterase